MKKSITARQLRIVLIITMVLLGAALVGGFGFAQQMLTQYATQISKLNADAQAGDANLKTLQSLKTRLSNEQDTILKTRSVVADNASYTNKIIDDIGQIARSSGVQITSFEFVENTAASIPQAAAPATADTAAPTTAPKGVVLKTVSVTVESPLSYNSLMDFLKKLETNNLRMQVSSVSIAKDAGNNVTTQTLSIEVYVRL